MRTVAHNEDIQRRIRFLIQRQHDHERQWWTGREALLQKQSAREEKKRELDEVLYVLSLPTYSSRVT
jgi:L-rhamnose mutarotase